VDQIAKNYTAGERRKNGIYGHGGEKPNKNPKTSDL